VSLHRFTLGGVPATPWKNGGGSTRDLLCWPPGAGLEHFDWRVSVATIAADGPFSRFPGIDRHIVLLEGGGVHLQGEGIDHRLATPLQPFAFSGDAALHCTRLDGTSTDFNAMARRGRGSATVRVLQGESWALDGATHLLLLAVRGHWRLGDEALAAGSGVWWAGTPRSAHLVPGGGDAQLVAAGWQPAALASKAPPAPAQQARQAMKVDA